MNEISIPIVTKLDHIIFHSVCELKLKKNLKLATLDLEVFDRNKENLDELQ